MLAWFVVAVIYLPDGKEAMKHITRPFQTRELCQAFYRNTPSVRKDIMIMFPEQTGHSLMCFNQEQLDLLREQVKRQQDEQA